MSIRIPPVTAGSPFARRAPDLVAGKMAVSAAPESQAAALLAHAGPDVLTQLLTEATEGDGYVDISASCRLTLHLQKRTPTSIERFGLIGRLYGTASKDLAFVVERLQQDPDPTKDAGDILAIEVDEVMLETPPHAAEDDWVQRRLCALQEAASLPLVLAGQEFANHERQWLAKQAEQDARPYDVETEGFVCGKCENLQQNGPRCAVCGATNGDRAAGAVIVLSRRGGFKEGDRVVITPRVGGEREGQLLRAQGGGGRRWLVKLRDEGALGPGTIRPQPITAVVEVQQRTLNGFAAGDISLRRVAALLIAPDEVRPPVATALEPFDARLNPSQREAVAGGLGLLPGSMMLVQGPPGTGKTTSIVETVRQLVARDPEVRILMTSHANTAVDNAQERLQGLDSLRMVRIAEPEKVDPKFRASIVDPDDPRVRSAHVVFGTVNRIALACREAEMFDWLILDEANKVRFTETLPLLRLAPRWLLVGDHRQLPPVLDESAAAFPVDEDEARIMVRDASFFELSWAVLPEGNLVMLDEQYRMAAPIGTYVSQASYDGRLQNSPEMAALRSPLPWPFNRNLTWLTIRGREKKSGSGSLSNRAEIEAVGRVVRHLQRLGLGHLKVAVIAMYQDQVTQLRRELRNIDLPQLYVDTVDAFEGEEADVVILSLVRSNEAERIGFLKKAQRLNVAISRAKHLLIVVGDIETLTGREGQDLYRPLLEHIEREGRVAGIGALHAMDAAVGGRRRDRRRGRVGGQVGPRRGRRRRPYVSGGTAAVGPNGAETVAEGTPTGTGVEGAVGQPSAAPRRFRRRRGRRRGPGRPPLNGDAGQAPAGEQAPAPARPEPAQVAQAD